MTPLSQSTCFEFVNKEKRALAYKSVAIMLFSKLTNICYNNFAQQTKEKIYHFLLFVRAQRRRVVEVFVLLFSKSKEKKKLFELSGTTWSSTQKAFKRLFWLFPFGGYYDTPQRVMRDRRKERKIFMSNIKGRNWAFVAYPESMPNNWFELLQNTGLPIAVSPLHDKDINPDGTLKKAHYHFICYYENTTTSNNVKTNVCDLINATIPIKLESMVGMYRYHLHLDNPEKYQYDDRFRTFINGFDVSRVTQLTTTEVKKILIDLQSFIKDNDIIEYADLLDLLLDNEFFNMLEVAQSHTILLNTYITSRRHKKKID